MKFGSLFTGFGGMDLGLERAGHEVAWQVEINDYARRVLEKHWPNVRRHDDACTFPPPAWVPCDCCDNMSCTWHSGHAHDCPESECPDLETWDYEWGLNPYEDFHPKWREIDAIVGGDPCQQNSGARGYGYCRQPSLGDQFIRIVDALRPRIVLRENPTHTRKDAPWPWWRFRSALESLGYAVLPFRLRACCFGLEHQRDRLFLLAELADANRNRLEGWQEFPAERRHAEPPRLVQAENRVDLLATCGFRSRAGLPDYVERVRGIGNSVCPQVAEYIGRMISQTLAVPRSVVDIQR